MEAGPKEKIKERKELVKQIVTPTKIYLNVKKGACNETRSSEEEHVGMLDSMRKGDFEHSNE